MKKHLLHYILISLLYTTASAQGLFTGLAPIGTTATKGTAQYNETSQEYILEAANGNVWAEQDNFHFLWKKLKGNFILQAQINFTGTGKEPQRKAGWMIRESLETNAQHISAAVHGNGRAALQYRKKTGAATEEIRSNTLKPDVIQLERKGNTYIMSVARFGEPFTVTSLKNISLSDDIYVGLFLCSHNEAVTEKINIRNVRIVIPAKDNFMAYREYIGSHIETMDIEKGNRKILYTEPGSLQAPNWTPDNRSLIYNSSGLLYRLELATAKPEKINTDPCNSNNNDHVLSFDGKMMGISSHSSKDSGVSIIYTVPVTGGTPQRITAEGPSYLHGWSPDGKQLVYTARRNGEFDIYSISSSGGKETRLTTAAGLDDGPEYSPDGQYIYFNSTRTGLMQLWRMRPDGSDQEQLTNDGYNNWFPHISPDGRWIVFLSFMNDVPPGDHPFYKHVYIRLMPVDGGQPKVIAYLYGGQGTINVPSWSPDSKKIAFVSNSD